MAVRQADQAGSPDGRPEPVSPGTAVSLAVLAAALVLAALVAWRLLVDPQALVDRLVAGDGGWVALVRGLVGR
jgi:hypothetical protein